MKRPAGKKRKQTIWGSKRVYSKKVIFYVRPCLRWCFCLSVLRWSVSKTTKKTPCVEEISARYGYKKVFHLEAVPKSSAKDVDQNTVVNVVQKSSPKLANLRVWSIKSAAFELKKKQDTKVWSNHFPVRGTAGKALNLMAFPCHLSFKKKTVLNHLPCDLEGSGAWNSSPISGK